MTGQTFAVNAPTLPDMPQPRSPIRSLANPTTIFSVSILGIFLALALFSDVIAPYGKNEPTTAYFASPSRDFPLGTDNLGRDMLSRTIHGARVSLQVGVLAVLMGTVSGAAMFPRS